MKEIDKKNLIINMESVIKVANEVIKELKKTDFDMVKIMNLSVEEMDELCNNISSIIFRRVFDAVNLNATN